MDFGSKEIALKTVRHKTLAYSAQMNPNLNAMN